MSRGKSYDHKKKGHPGAFPKNTLVDEEEYEKSIQQTEDLASYEAFKNRINDENE